MSEETKDQVPAQPAPETPAVETPAEAADAAPAAPAAPSEAPAAEAPAADAKPAPAAEAAPAAKPAAAAPAAEEGDAEPKAQRRRVKGSKNIPVGVVHILASFNNTTVCVSDPRGNVISWSSGGRCGFKGSRKSTAYAGTIVAQEACKVAIGHGLNEVEIRVQGPGSGRESAIRAVQAAGLTITGIRDITPVPHNGCRARKRRRV